MKKFSIFCLLFLIICGYISHEDKSSDKYLIPRNFQLVNGRGSCSGEQIHAPSGIDYILTAGHCADLARNGSILVILEDGRRMERRIIAEDSNSDLLLLEGIPNLRGLELGDFLKQYDHVRTLTHGGGFKAYKTEGYAVQRALVEIFLRPIESQDDEFKCLSAPKFYIDTMETIFGEEVRVCTLKVWEHYMTAKIIPGSSGGMVVNDDGELVGVVSAGGNAADFGLVVGPLEIKKFLSSY